MSRSTEKLSTNLTQLKERCLEFSQTAQSLNATRVLTSLALSRHTQLLEILELPQLMDTCVRNGYWEEALELASYVSRLQRKLAHIPLILVLAFHFPSHYWLTNICITLFIESCARSPIMYKTHAESVGISVANASTTSSLPESSWLFEANGSVFWRGNSPEISPSKGRLVQIYAWRNT